MHFFLKHNWYYESPVSRICVDCGKMQTMDVCCGSWHTKNDLELWKERSAAQLRNYDEKKIQDALNIEKRKQLEEYVQSIKSKASPK